MYHPRLLSLNSPLSPIPPMKKFDFSINSTTCSQSFKSMGLSSSTPELNISSPNMSPIKFVNSTMQQLNSPVPPIDLDSFNKRMGSLSFDTDEDKDNSLNKSNINNRHLNVSTILDDLGLTQYKTLFRMQEIDLMAFFLLTDNDLQELGITNENHRETFKGYINKIL